MNQIIEDFGKKIDLEDEKCIFFYLFLNVFNLEKNKTNKAKLLYLKGKVFDLSP